MPATAISRICDEFRQLQDTWGWESQRRALVTKLQLQKQISRNIKWWRPLTKQHGNTSNHTHSSSYWYLRNNQVEVSNNRCPYEEIWKPLLKAPVERYGRDSNSAQLLVCNVWCTVASGAKRTECSHEWQWREALGPHFCGFHSRKTGALSTMYEYWRDDISIDIQKCAHTEKNIKSMRF